MNKSNGRRPSGAGTTRRALLLGMSTLPLCSIRTRPAEAAEFTYRFATDQDPTHPVNKRGQEAIDRIREATSGWLDIKLFPANQLGSDRFAEPVTQRSVEFSTCPRRF